MRPLSKLLVGSILALALGLGPPVSALGSAETPGAVGLPKAPEAALEAVFLALLHEHGLERQVETRLCLGDWNKSSGDLSPELLESVRRKAGTLQFVNCSQLQNTVRDGVIDFHLTFFVSEAGLREDGEVVATAGYYCGMECSATARYRLVRSAEGWKIAEITGLAIS